MFEDLRRRYVDLAQPRLGSEVVSATDDFFADKARLIAPEPPQFIPGKYDDNGKWMDVVSRSVSRISMRRHLGGSISSASIRMTPSRSRKCFARRN